MQQKIFITGATGLVGSWLCRKFLEEGYQVLALKRKTSSMDLVADVKDRIEWFEGDITQKETLRSPIRQADIVVHAAAMLSFEAETADLMRKINVIGTQNTVELCLEEQTLRYCFVGSTAGLGKPKNTETIDEDIDRSQSEKNTLYALTKYQSEQLVWQARDRGLKAVIVNPPYILGIGSWDQSSGRLIDYVWRQKTHYPSGIINLVDIRDLIEVIARLIREEVYGDRYIVSAAHMDFGAFFNQVATHLGVPPPSKRLSPFLAGFLWRMEKVRAKLTGSKPFITRANAESTSARFIYQNEKIRKRLSYSFRPMEETIAWVCDAFKADQS